MDTSQQRRSGIPIAKNTVQIKRQLLNKSKSDLNDLDAFTLLEENISLKEFKEDIMTKYTETVQKNIELERDNTKMKKQMDTLEKQQKMLKDQLDQIVQKFQKEIHEGQTLQNIQEEQKRIINDLISKLRVKEHEHSQLIEASREAKLKLGQIIPDLNNKMIINDSNNNHNGDDGIAADEVMSQLINDIGNIKTHLNSTELQLYEANEKISELIENQHHLDVENESLKGENANLTKVAKLMTSSMKESVDTSKKMEAALITMKKRNDELISEKLKDSTDSPSPRLLSTNEQVVQLQDELKQQQVQHSERIVEMTKLMENAIESNYSEQIQLLELKIEMLEKELEITIERAEKAETELDELRRSSKQNRQQTIKLNTTTTKPPPLPPPMPTFNLIPNNSYIFGKRTANNNSNNNNSLNDNPSDTILKRQQVKKATGMDALIAELRDGSVTLRKNRRVSRKHNERFDEMFQMLEISRKQNRNSNMLVDSQFSVANNNNNNNTISDLEYV